MEVLHSNVFQNSLFKHAEWVKRNFDASNSRFSKTNLAAEMINNLLDQLYSQEFQAGQEKLCDASVKMMLFGTYQSWTYAYVLTSSGLSDIGLTLLRRAIEFVCYIAKIHQSDERARIWKDQIQNEDLQKEFKRSFRIPDTFFREKYRELRPLLICHDAGVNAFFS